MSTLTTKTLALLMLTALLSVACSETAEKGQDPMFGKKKAGLLAVGSKAPGFAVPDHEGNIVKLSDMAGKRVLLWFYPKADTPG